MKTIILMIVMPLMAFGQKFTDEDFKEIARRFETIDVKAVNKGVNRYYDVHREDYIVSSNEYEMEGLTLQLIYHVVKYDSSIMRSPLILKVKYASSNWIFMESASLAYPKPNTLPIQNIWVDFKSPARDVNGNATISERGAKHLTKTQEAFFFQMAENPERVSIRITGDTQYAERNIIGKLFIVKMMKFFDSVKLFEVSPKYKQEE